MSPVKTSSTCGKRAHAALRARLKNRISLGIACGGRNAKQDDRVIDLVGFEQATREFGGRSQTHRQQPAGKRIQSARVSALDAPEELAHRLQRGVGRQAERLVQQHYAVYAVLSRGKGSLSDHRCLPPS